MRTRFAGSCVASPATSAALLREAAPALKSFDGFGNKKAPAGVAQGPSRSEKYAHITWLAVRVQRRDGRESLHPTKAAPRVAEVSMVKPV